MGSIPARAGEPRSARSPRASSGVYPRASGGTLGQRHHDHAAHGLSPRERGNQVVRVGLVAVQRSIPARAGEPASPQSARRSCWVYPRASGGTLIGLAGLWSAHGLSPRERGNRGVEVVADGLDGSIPARAGEPTGWRAAPPRSAVYPRASGGTSISRPSSSSIRGLSPRERGNSVGRSRAHAPRRSIPARAGEPRGLPGPGPTRPVYPRASGGTPRHDPVPRSMSGLSPRERGNPARSGRPEPELRSIPARAGEPCSRSSRAATTTVYPRASGGTSPSAAPPQVMHGLSPRERGNPASPGRRPSKPEVYPRASGGTDAVVGGGEGEQGLSPRERGNRHRAACGSSAGGSIPARAGEPDPRWTTSSPPRVYPRASGGTQLGIQTENVTSGLSPRERGNLLRLSTKPTSARSIPARAGEPCRRCRRRAGTPVYPRASGGTHSPMLGFITSAGLSPRERGNQDERPDEPLDQRSIPARAGEPRSRRAAPTGSTVYPRASGGTRCSGPGQPRSWGLSPRERGNHPGQPHPRQPDGSIPARAGEPPSRRKPPGRHRVYPRASGGTSSARQNPRVARGLSPRERGNPRSLGATACRTTVYPRASGGTGGVRTNEYGAFGLSPRERGNLLDRGEQSPWSRSIPARAGEPRSSSAASSLATVYPRASGGTSQNLRSQVCRTGLSPRERGTDPVPDVSGRVSGLSPRERGNRADGDRGLARTGSIPARAGEPLKP